MHEKTLDINSINESSITEVIHNYSFSAVKVTKEGKEY